MPGRTSINPEGAITFDLDTFKQMGEPLAVLLLFEESTRTIGLKPSDPDVKNAVIVRARHKVSNKVVRSKPFLEKNGVHLEGTIRIPYPRVEDGVLILDLRTAIKCGKGMWKKFHKP